MSYAKVNGDDDDDIVVAKMREEKRNITTTSDEDDDASSTQLLDDGMKSNDAVSKYQDSSSNGEGEDSDHEDEYSFNSIEVGSNDESFYCSDDEEKSELIKKDKREFVIGQSPIYLERNTSFFSNGIEIHQDLNIIEIIKYLEENTRDSPTFLSSYIDKVTTLHNNSERLLWHYSDILFDGLPINIHGEGFDDATDHSIMSFQKSIEVNIPWLIKMLGNFHKTFGEIVDRLIFTKLLQCFANYMVDNKKGCLDEPKRKGYKWVKQQGNSLDGKTAGKMAGN